MAEFEVIPADLVPLGLAHSDAHREILMPLVERHFRGGKLTLYARIAREPAPIPHPFGLALNWMAGPSGEDELELELEFYCQVSAIPGPTAHPHRGYLRDHYTKVLISKAELDRMSVLARAFVREWVNMTSGAPPAEAQWQPRPMSSQVLQEHLRRAGRNPSPDKTYKQLVANGHIVSVANVWNEYRAMYGRRPRGRPEKAIIQPD